MVHALFDEVVRLFSMLKGSENVVMIFTQAHAQTTAKRGMLFLGYFPFRKEPRQLKRGKTVIIWFPEIILIKLGHVPQIVTDLE